MEEKTIVEFTQDEVKKIQELQQKILTINARIGETELQIHGLEQSFQELKTEKSRLITEFSEVGVLEDKLASELKEKYGEGTYDISTNHFKPKFIF